MYLKRRSGVVHFATHIAFVFEFILVSENVKFKSLLRFKVLPTNIAKKSL